jgi:response regulator RpfG family c-di-GMP phosphodiesterase
MMNILLVDDDAATVTLLERRMVQWGYQVQTAENGRQAVDRVQSEHVDMLVSDWLMPEMNGLELCKAVRSLNLPNYIYIILISAQDTRTDVVRGLEGGVDDFLAKPINLEELRVRMEIGARIIKLERELNQKYRTIKRNYYQTLRMFTELLENYDKALGGHSRRVGHLALSIAKRHADIRPEDYPIIEAAGMLHDVGLVGLPGGLVHKQVAEMTGDEKQCYRSHPERGEAILNQIDLLRPIARIVRMHHEQVNGRGFPDGLKADQIPLSASVVNAASIYDHLRNIRKISFKELPEHLQKMRGYQIDSSLVDLLLEINMDQMQEEAKRTEREVDIEDLEPGMVLSRDVLMRTGAFFMASDTRIEADTIAKLTRYHELGNIGSTLFVHT